MYVSKKTAREIAGKNGVTKKQIDVVTKAVTAVAKLAKDIDKNGEIDSWELGRAAKSAHLKKAARSVLFSAYGTAVMVSSPL